MALILNQTDPEVFEQTGRADAETLATMVEPGATAVDLGCGIGRVARYLAPHCGRLWAVDASSTMLSLARSRLGALPNVEFALCEETSVPAVPDSSVDLVYGLLVLQHLEREDAFQLMREARRMLKPTGRALFTFPNIMSDPYLDAFIAYVDAGEVTNRSRARFYTPQEVHRLLPAAGLAIESIEEGVEIWARCRPDDGQGAGAQAWSTARP